ncbi:hypothetical protein ABBQ32_007304 [Trebouxia sp. C0010 RCD-2024]
MPSDMVKVSHKGGCQRGLIEAAAAGQGRAGQSLIQACPRQSNPQGCLQVEGRGPAKEVPRLAQGCASSAPSACRRRHSKAVLIITQLSGTAMTKYE